MTSTSSDPVKFQRHRPPGWDNVKNGVQAGFAALWGAGFASLAAIRRSRDRVQTTVEDGRVLIVAPHPDDEVVGCGGAVLRHKAAGARVAIVYVTDGRSSRAFGLDPAAMAVTRRREAEEAAAILGVDRVDWLGLPEGAWSAMDLTVRLRELVGQWAPAVIYAPSRVDFHPEHQRVAHTLAQTVATPSGPGEGPLIRIYQVQVPLGAVLVNRVVDITGVESSCHAALMAHVSQRGAILRSLRMKRYAAQAHQLVGMAEEFWELPAAAYSALHLGLPVEWLERYRGCRYLSVTDPAAYLVGRTARRHLRGSVARGIKGGSL